MANELITKLNAKIEGAEQALKTARNEAEIEAVRVEILGRNGFIHSISAEMKNIPPQEKPEFGKAFNLAKNKIESLLVEAKENLKAGSAKKSEGLIDVTLPGRKWPLGTKHPISKVIDDCVAIFRRMGFIVAEGPEIETVYHNFDALNTPADHPSRDPQDTFYFGDGRLLRTQTSTVQIRYMEKNQPPVRIVSPGRCYRRDTPDATHSMNFHQIEGLYIDKNVSMADLKSTLLYFGKELMGSETQLRLRPHFFPFTEPSVECDFSCIMCGGKGCRVCKFSGWLEIAGAGMVNPNVLRNVGFNPEDWSGYAFGMGIERIAMIRYKINDIRLLYENDMRFLEQF
ncbi:MAG TPA: phenylalanine--tRNA ligase subunit alpha [Lentisphaeria bacterium]|nr:MAG: phenylalanine--tRNA ligase subunit alpha [Lentisphaerae bacterium GWF2_49_21]HBC86606.1 phenylalanine--tRNA ligase subunit alpha [Lentisphaeria bacterium]